MNEIKPNVGKHGNEMFMKDSVNKITEDAGSLPRENYIQMNKEITNIDTLKNEKFNEEIQKKIKPNTSLREQPSSLILNISTYGDVKNDNSNNNNNNSAKISKLTNKDTNIKMDAMQNERRGNRIPTNNSSDFVSTKMQHLPSKGDTSNEKNEYPIDKKEHKIDCIDSKGSNHEYMSNKHGDTNVKDSHTDSKQEHMNSKCGYINTKDNRANSKHNPINNKPNRINLNMRNINKQTDTECRKGYDDKMRNGIKHAKIEKKTGAILHKNNKIKSSGILGSELISKDNKINNNEIKNKKNPYDVSNEKKLKILEKRVRCLNTYYNRKDMGSCSLNSSVQYNDGNINGNENSIKKNVLLLLTRDFRIADNWSIIYAYDMAKKKQM